MESAPINDPGLSAKPIVVRELLGVTYQVERQMRGVVRKLYNEKMKGVDFDEPVRELLKDKSRLMKGIAEEASRRLIGSGFSIISRASWYPNWVFAQIHVRRTQQPRAQTSKSSMESAPEHEAATSGDAGEAGPEVGAEVGAGVGAEIEAGAGAGVPVVRWRPW